MKKANGRQVRMKKANGRQYKRSIAKFNKTNEATDATANTFGADSTVSKFKKFMKEHYDMDMEEEDNYNTEKKVQKTRAAKVPKSY